MRRHSLTLPLGIQARSEHTRGALEGGWVALKAALASLALHSARGGQAGRMRGVCSPKEERQAKSSSQAWRPRHMCSMSELCRAGAHLFASSVGGQGIARAANFAAAQGVAHFTATEQRVVDARLAACGAVLVHRPFRSLRVGDRPQGVTGLAFVYSWPAAALAVGSGQGAVCNPCCHVHSAAVCAAPAAGPPCP